MREPSEDEQTQPLRVEAGPDIITRTPVKEQTTRTAETGRKSVLECRSRARANRDSMDVEPYEQKLMMNVHGQRQHGSDFSK
ncbi:hypothetical protein R1flu_013384 [Riccia fluitans]|uniref:Uncharacterized protein n=1 Tax=Riccia fluitans TaxID=41844 RepID=A0ABD1YD62_9MARC